MRDITWNMFKTWIDAKLTKEEKTYDIERINIADLSNQKLEDLIISIDSDRKKLIIY